MKKRILSTISLFLLIFIVVSILKVAGGILLLAALTGLAQWELYQLLERGGHARPNKPLGVTLGVLIVIGAYLLPNAGGMEITGLCIAVLLTTLLANPRVGEVFLPTLFGIVYLPFMMVFYSLLAVTEFSYGIGGLFVPLWVVLVAKSSDIGGLLVGSRIGKTKLMPSVSPGKTVEGAIGGIIFSAVIGVLIAKLFASYDPVGFTFMSAALIGAVIGAIAIVSDLLESRIKRWAGAKDSGTLIPGIGGAFDLVDSLVLVAPVSFILLQYVAS